MYVLTLEWTIAGKSYEKTEALTGPKTLGRAAESTFAVMDATVSKRQAQITAGASGARIKNLSSTVKIKLAATELGQNEEAPLTNKLNFTIGGVTFYSLVITVPDGSTLTASCTTCHRAIPEGTTTCPWCGSTQQQTEGGFTMA